MMLPAIFFVFLITLAKLQSGDGVERNGSFSGRRFPNFSSSSAPAPAPVSDPPLSPPQGGLTTSPSSRFSSSFALQQSASPIRGRPSAYDDTSSMKQSTNSSNGLFGNSSVTPKARKPNFDAPGQFSRDDSKLLGGAPDFGPGVKPIAVRVDRNGNPLDPIPGGYMYSRGGPVMTESAYLKQQKKKEEEANPDSHSTNTTGETIQQKLPRGGGEIVIKISGSNITQSKMNQVRKLLEESVEFVFGHPEFISGLANRYV